MSSNVLLAQVPEFEAMQAARCADLGIDVSTFEISHVAVRCVTWREYVEAREELEAVSIGNHENVWNGRPISKLLLRDAVPLTGDRSVELVELIPPFHQRVYRMGLEHMGYVVGEVGFPAFVDRHLDVLTGQQFQSRETRPVYRLFADYTHVKFYERSLRKACELEGADFSRFTHAEWRPVDPDAGPYEV